MFHAKSVDVADKVLSHCARGTQATENAHDQSAVHVAMVSDHFFMLTVESASAVQFTVIVGVFTRVQDTSVMTGASGATVSIITVNVLERSEGFHATSLIEA